MKENTLCPQNALQWVANANVGVPPSKPMVRRGLFDHRSLRKSLVIRYFTSFDGRWLTKEMLCCINRFT